MKYRSVYWSIPQALYEEIKKAREEYESSEGRKFASEEEFGVALVHTGLQVLLGELQRNKVIEEPKIVVPEGPWSKAPSKETPWIR